MIGGVFVKSARLDFLSQSGKTLVFLLPDFAREGDWYASLWTCLIEGASRVKVWTPHPDGGRWAELTLDANADVVALLATAPSSLKATHPALHRAIQRTGSASVVAHVFAY